MNAEELHGAYTVDPTFLQLPPQDFEADFPEFHHLQSDLCQSQDFVIVDGPPNGDRSSDDPAEVYPNTAGPGVDPVVPDTTDERNGVLSDYQVERPNFPLYPASDNFKAATPSAKSRKRLRCAKLNHKSRRHPISPSVKAFLNTQFDHDPYPSVKQTNEWARQHELPQKTIRNWFSNARSRRQPEMKEISKDSTPLELGPEQHSSSNVETLEPPSPTPSNLSLERYLSASPQEEAVSEEAIQANIDAARHEYGIPASYESNPYWDFDNPTFRPLNPYSPFQDNNSRTAYFPGAASPYTHNDFGNTEFVPNPFSDYNKYTSPFNQGYELPWSDDAGDRGSSAGSMGSAHSHGSIGSHYSLDSRGSRRGRRCWTKSPIEQSPAQHDTHSQEPSVQDKTRLLKAFTPPVLSRFYCSFPGCGRLFTNQYEWSRHEESIHYPQKAWVCCNITDTEDIPDSTSVGRNILQSTDIAAVWKQIFETRFSLCAAKPKADRTFYRKDQLVQHIKTCHIDVAKVDDTADALLMAVLVRQTLPKLWETELFHTSREISGRYCSACDLEFPTWAERKSHFISHFQTGIFIWSQPNVARDLGAVFVPREKQILRLQSFNNRPYSCPTCSASFPTYEVALNTHQGCRGWCCQYLKDPSAIFASVSSTTSDPEVHHSFCKLCDNFSEYPIPGHIMTEKKKEHAKLHGFHSCFENATSDFQGFCAHLKTHAGIGANYIWKEADLQAWMREVKSSVTFRVV